MNDPGADAVPASVRVAAAWSWRLLAIAAGIVGVLFAVPIAAVLNTVILYLHGQDEFPALGTDDHFELRAPAVEIGPERVGT